MRKVLARSFICQSFPASSRNAANKSHKVGVLAPSKKGISVLLSTK